MTMGHPHGKAGSCGFREAGLSGPVVCHSEPASNQLTQKMDDSPAPKAISTSAPLAPKHLTELPCSIRGECGRSKLREKILCHKSSPNDHRCSIAETSESNPERCAIRVSTDINIVSKSSDNVGASTGSPQVETTISSSSSLPQRMSLNLNGQSPSKSSADSIQTTPTRTSFSRRFSGTNGRHQLSSRTSVSYSDCSALEDTGVMTSRDTMLSSYDTRRKSNTRRESLLNESPFAIVETWNNKIPIHSISAEDQSPLIEPQSSHPVWDTSSPNTVAPTPESLVSNVVSPITPNFSSSPMADDFLSPRTIAKHLSPASKAVSPISAAPKSPYLGTPAPLGDVANGWVSYSPPRLGSGEPEHEYMPFNYKIYDPAVPYHRPAPCGLVASVPGTQWAAESSPTQPCLPSEEPLNLTGPIHWSGFVESLEPETPSITYSSMTQFDTPDSINLASMSSLACSTPLAHNLPEDSGLMYESIQAMKAEMPMSNLSPIDLNDNQEDFFQLPSPVDYSAQHSPFTSPSEVILNTPRSKANPGGLGPSQVLLQSQSGGLQMNEGEIAGSEHDIISAHQGCPHPANVLNLSSSAKDSPQCSEPWPLLVAHSSSQQTLVEQLQAFFSAVNNDWMQKLKSDPGLELRCSAMPPRALLKKGICTLRDCVRGRVIQSFEDVFSLLHLAIAAALLLRYQQGFYCWDTFFNDALQWQHVLLKDEDRSLFLKALDPKFRPSPTLYSNRSAILRDVITDGSIYSGDHILLPHAVKHSELLRICNSFLEGRSMNMSFKIYRVDSNRFIGFERSGIDERNLRFPAAAFALHSQNRQWKIQHMIRTITRPLQEERGIKAFHDIVVDAESQINRGLLLEPREVEVILLSNAKVSLVSSVLPVSHFS